MRAYDGESPEFVRETKPTARKARRCCECRKRIEPGDRYERVDGKWDGIVSTFSSCLLCEKMRTYVVAYQGAHAVPCFGYLFEALEEGEVLETAQAWAVEAMAKEAAMASELARKERQG